MKYNPKGNIKVFDTEDELNSSAADFIIGLAKKSIKERGRFVFCLSGGDTPKGLYHLLSELHYISKMPWNYTFVFWSDERCVSFDDERNNAFMAKTVLLNKCDIPPSHIFRIPVELAPAIAAKKYEKTIKGFYCSTPPRFDLILLGLGEDGHTASLFPDTNVLAENKRLVMAVCDTKLENNRVTFMPSLINKSRNIIFMVTGKKKSKILEKVMNAPFDPEKYPAQLIHPEDGVMHWFVDRVAASDLME